MVLWKQEDGKFASKHTQHEVSHFVDCILHDKTPITDGKIALKSLQVIWKMYDAEKFGVIQISLDFFKESYIIS